MSKIIVIGGPRSGKSTFAKIIAVKNGLTHYCTDARSMVKDVQADVNYLPEGLAWGDDSVFISKNWFVNDGNWVIEGVGAVRALRKWAENNPSKMPCDMIVVFKNKYPGVVTNSGQDSMHKSIRTIWEGIADNFKSITQEI